MVLSEMTNHTTPILLEMGYKIPSRCLPLGSTDKEYRELSACRSVWFGLKECKLIDKTIKSGPEMVSDFANEDSPSWVRWKTSYPDTINLPATLRIELRLDNLIVRFLPEGNFGHTESLDFTFCTPDLETRTIERVHDECSACPQESYC